MKCPSCESERVYHSRAKSVRDRVLKRLLPITIYRCHSCGWRRMKLRKLTGKQVVQHVLSIIGYIGSIGVALALMGAIVLMTLNFLGIPMPWSH